MSRLGVVGCAGALALAIAGCFSPADVEAPRPTPAPDGVRFRDIASEAGLRFSLTGGPLERMTIVNASAGGAGLLDYDADGDLDLLLLGLRRLKLYRNEGGGRFTEVAERAGLSDREDWMGCAAGDLDADGDPDLLLTGYRCLKLYRNDAGRFADETAVARLPQDRWSTSAAFADWDSDGDLDLYVGAYVEFGPGSQLHCPAGIDPDGRAISGPCGPEPYPAQRGRLFRNDGPFRFTDVTAASGLTAATGKTLGVAAGDYDGDGAIDLYLANDRMAGDLFRNRGGLRFENVAERTGTAYNREGKNQAGMGVDWGDADGDGDLDLFVGTYQDEPKSLYRNDGRGLFREVSRTSGLAPADPWVTFGTRWFDPDNDGDLDLVLANGHALGPVSRIDRTLSYEQPLQLFLNDGSGRFVDGSSAAGPAFTQPRVGRALAVGDVDNDGRQDLVVANLEGEPLLLRNETEPVGHWLRVRLEGRAPNRDGIGARVTATAGGRKLVREVTASSSYLAASDPRVHLGLGSAAEVSALTVRWPSGKITRKHDVDGGREVTVRE